MPFFEARVFYLLDTDHDKYRQPAELFACDIGMLDDLLGSELASFIDPSNYHTSLTDLLFKPSIQRMGSNINLGTDGNADCSQPPQEKPS